MSFIRWMGSKSKVLHIFKDYFPDFSKINGYIEPFLGGGSVFFYLKENGYLDGKPVYLSDINSELITTYRIVRDNPEKLIPLLDKHQKNDSREYFDKEKLKLIRYNENGQEIDIAASFIYLNKCSFAGMWRVNSKGEPNMPYKGDNLHINLVGGSELDRLKECSKLLQDTNINRHSFEKIININNGNLKDWFIYQDPPYYNTNWTGYTKDGFGLKTRTSIPSIFRELDKRGAKLMLSNAECSSIYGLFKGYDINVINTDRTAVNLSQITKEKLAKDKEKGVNEVIVTNYKISKKQKTIEDTWF